ncbi:beta-lactamase domain-containing protein, partial [mine drainage metagenome]
MIPMKLIVLGASEAFHERKTNISMLVLSDINLMIDCGYNVPQKFWQEYPDKDFLDAVFVSHFHADHVSGLPMLLMRMRQDKRTKPLTLIGPSGFEKSFKQLYELVYKGFFEASGFPIKFIEVKGGDKVELEGLTLSFADANHLVGTNYFVPTIAIRVDSKDGAICYSADTVYTDRITDLAKGCNILIHDSFMPADSEYHKRMPAHSSPRDAWESGA